MPTVRKRRSRKNARINTTRYGSRLKKRTTKDVKHKIQFECIRRRWDSKKTLKQNLMELGLSFDSNKTVPLRKKDDNSDRVSDMEEKPQTQSPMTIQSDLVTELEAIAADTPASKQFLMSPSEAKFVACLILRHGTNYKKMARDKENYNQLTEGQLKKKCLYFHKSPYAYLLDADD